MNEIINYSLLFIGIIFNIAFVILIFIPGVPELLFQLPLITSSSVDNSSTKVVQGESKNENGTIDNFVKITEPLSTKDNGTVSKMKQRTMEETLPLEVRLLGYFFGISGVVMLFTWNKRRKNNN